MAYYKCGSIHPTQNSNVVVDTASGAVANFQTPLAMPLPKARFDFKATQEAGTPTPQSPKVISGVSELSVYKRASNLFNIATKTDGVFLVWSSGDTYADAKSVVSDYIEVKEGIKFTSNYIAQWCCYDKNKNYLGNIVAGSLIKTSGNDTTINTIPSGYGVYYLRLGYRSALNNDEDMTQKTDIILNVGNTATTYEAYAGNTEVINLGGTYYGGHFTQDKDGKRELTVTHKALVFTGSESWQTSTTFFYLPAGTLEDIPVQSPSICSNGLSITPMTNRQIRIYPSSGINSQYISMSSTASELQGYLSNGIQFLYELATPIIIDLPDGQPIKTLPGINNIFADTGDTSLQFRKIG